MYLQYSRKAISKSRTVKIDYLVKQKWHRIGREINFYTNDEISSKAVSIKVLNYEILGITVNVRETKIQVTGI